MLQKMRAGDIDFVNHVDRERVDACAAGRRAVAALHVPRPGASDEGAGRPAIDAGSYATWSRTTVQGAMCSACSRMGMRNMYSKKEVKSVEDIKGLRRSACRRPRPRTHCSRRMARRRCTCRSANVYTSLQTGVVNVAENGVNVYLANKHYEVAPVLSMTEHEANNNCIWVSDKTWNSLTPEQQGWVQPRQPEVGHTRAGARAEAGKGLRRQAQDHGREGRRRRRQVGLHQGRRADTGPAAPRNSARTRSRSSSSSAKSSNPRRTIEGWRDATLRRVRLPLSDSRLADGDFRTLVLQRHRHLKWKAFDLARSGADDALRRVHLHVHAHRVFDVVTRTIGAPVAVAAAGHDGILRVGSVRRHGGRDPAQRSLLPD